MQYFGNLVCSEVIKVPSCLRTFGNGYTKFVHPLLYHLNYCINSFNYSLLTFSNLYIRFRTKRPSEYNPTSAQRLIYTVLFEMIVKVLTTATSFSRCNPMWFLSMGLPQGSGLCSFSSCKYPGTEGSNQNHHWNHHRWHATNSLEWTRLSCWCL